MKPLKLNVDEFFNSMSRQELKSFEELYLDYMKKTTNDLNISTGKNYTQKEIDELYEMSKGNLIKISFAKNSINLPSKDENPNGLHKRYIISKADGEPVDDNAEYFVLRLDDGGSDPKHIAACRKAIITYAMEIKDHLPELSKDLYDRYSIGESV